MRPRALPQAGPRAGTSIHSCTVFTCDITLVCQGPPAVPFAEIEWRLRELDRRFTRFTADSELSRLNAGAGRWHDISPELHRLLAHALNVAMASDGLINIAVLPRLVAAGYPDSLDGPAVPAVDPVPVPPLTSVLELRRRQARLQPGHAVDLGGLAKGVWADDVVSWLGPDSAASLGGDVSCRGPGPRGEGWPVETPSGQVVVVRDGAVATSGTAKRRWGEGLHHLIDPRTGCPSMSDVDEATVVASTGACADWVATAAVVGGTAAAQRLSARTDVLDISLRPVKE
ncbi:FAD:protein FMN transferase [Amycolatopsis sp. GM8]|uniref:FAD:protein FMN transferase n=1 Tax=Amycolatopsis sp. GM8 TaxID=2896530 RepID=UPI001F332058|nr:FAD:protein FMN transferase [Amycolatopsis sp. GM8]